MVLRLVLVTFVSGFSLDLIHISHRKYQSKPFSSLWFSPTCVAVMLIETFSFVFTNKRDLVSHVPSSAKQLIMVNALDYGKDTR